jgi:hypothetical protein
MEAEISDLLDVFFQFNAGFPFDNIENYQTEGILRELWKCRGTY